MATRKEKTPESPPQLTLQECLAKERENVKRRLVEDADARLAKLAEGKAAFDAAVAEAASK